MTVIEAPANGYIEAVDDDRLMAVAADSGVVLKLHHNPGDYLFAGQPLASAWPSGKLGEEVSSDVADAYEIGANRTPSQDMMFLVDELVEIAARALSSGVNDPYTAMTCLDWVGAAAAQLGGRKIPDKHRLDDHGKLRIIALPETFEGFVGRSFGRMRQYLARDMNASIHALEVLEALAEGLNGPARIDPLAEEAERLMELAGQELKGPSLVQLRECYAKIAPGFSATPGARR